MMVALIVFGILFSYIAAGAILAQWLRMKRDWAVDDSVGAGAFVLLTGPWFIALIIGEKLFSPKAPKLIPPRKAEPEVAYGDTYRDAPKAIYCVKCKKAAKSHRLTDKRIKQCQAFKFALLVAGSSFRAIMVSTMFPRMRQCLRHWNRIPTQCIMFPREKLRQ